MVYHADLRRNSSVVLLLYLSLHLLSNCAVASRYIPFCHSSLCK